MVAVALGLAVGGCERVPRDPEGTLERARGGTIRVGIAANPPWTRPGPDRTGGIEARLVEDFARSLNARVAWVSGGESDLLRALESFQLDIVIGGLTDDTKWDRRVGLTRPYVRTKTLVGEAPGAASVTDLTGKEVAVRQGDPAARTLESKGAKPLISVDPWTNTKLVAAQGWQLLARGYAATRFILEEHRHVMAVPPGENAFLLHLERFLKSREGEIETALIAHEDRRGAAAAR
jgi:polar amino acid transport system substrate-binding protein